MPIGDGIRRNIAKVSQAERDRFRDAILALDSSKFYPDGVSFWDKQDEIHQSTHVHGGPAFLPWHRELCNRFEELLRIVDPQLSLHYWDWTTDPRASNDGSGGTTNLFSTGATGFMGSASGPAGAPLTGFNVTRAVQSGAPSIASDVTIVTTGNGSPGSSQYQLMRAALEGAHNSSHGYIGGTIGNAHTAFEDPFVFLLHSNVDRLLAMWQLRPGHAWRLDPNQVYGIEGSSIAITENLEPWAGASGLRPWAPPDNQQVVKNCKDLSIVTPPKYDFTPMSVLVHLQNIGDRVHANDEFAGTRGQSRRLEGFQLTVDPPIAGLGIRYMAHLQNIGDTAWVGGGSFVGTRGQSRRLEGFAIELTGAQASNYDVSYFAHLQGIGDVPVVKNGAFCGTRGQSRRVEGIYVSVTPR